MFSKFSHLKLPWKISFEAFSVKYSLIGVTENHVFSQTKEIDFLSVFFSLFFLEFFVFFYEEYLFIFMKILVYTKIIFHPYFIYFILVENRK